MNSVNLKASVFFVGDGSTNRFYFGFDYINKQFVKVQIGNEGQSLTYPSDYTVDDRSVVLKDTPAIGVAIRIYRETPSDRIVDWADGAFIKASQMTLENLQQLHLIEEAQDYPILNSLSKYPDGVHFNALGSRVVNVSDPKDPQDAVTKHYMENVQDGFVAANTKILNEAKDTLSATQQTQSKAQANETLSKAWATSIESPDNADDTQSSTGKTQSSRSWALYSKSKAQEAAESAGVFQDFQGATETTDGNGGKVPKPLAGQQEKFLKADGTWGDGVTPKTLWYGMHYYPENYVPADLSNTGWNQLGFCSIYYTRPAIHNQPSPHGQLINIPADSHEESTQLWIEQNAGTIYSRGGNSNISIDATPFKRFATENFVSDSLRNALITLRKRTYPTVFDDDELTVIANGPFLSEDIPLSQPYTAFDGLLLVCTDDYHNNYVRYYISSIEITSRKEESIKLKHPSFRLFDGSLFWSVSANSEFSPTYFPGYDENCIIECIYGVKFKDITSLKGILPINAPVK